jgi:hypothetical protein
MLSAAVDMVEEIPPSSPSIPESEAKCVLLVLAGARITIEEAVQTQWHGRRLEPLYAQLQIGGKST